MDQPETGEEELNLAPPSSSLTNLASWLLIGVFCHLPSQRWYSWFGFGSGYRRFIQIPRVRPWIRLLIQIQDLCNSWYHIWNTLSALWLTDPPWREAKWRLQWGTCAGMWRKQELWSHGLPFIQVCFDDLLLSLPNFVNSQQILSAIDKANLASKKYCSDISPKCPWQFTCDTGWALTIWSWVCLTIYNWLRQILSIVRYRKLMMKQTWRPKNGSKIFHKI